MNVELRNITNLQIDLYRRIESFLEKCNDSNLFDIGTFPLYRITQDFQYLAEMINTYNLKSKFTKANPIKEPFIKLCDKLTQLPKMEDLYEEHIKRAKKLKTKYIKLMGRFGSMPKVDKEKFVDTEIELYYNALRFIEDSGKKSHYSKTALEIDNLKRAFCQPSIPTKDNVKSLEVKKGFAGNGNENIKSFCDKLVFYGYFDRENADKFMKMLEEGEIPKRIDWLRKKADVARLINCMSEKSLFVAQVNWKSFQSAFFFDGKPSKSLRTAAMSKKSDSDTEDVVKQSFNIK